MSNAGKPSDRLIKEFSENYMESLFYFCLKKTGNETEAEDLMQDIALNIITALNKGTIPMYFSAWIWRIARNRYSVWAREKHRRNQSVTGADIGDYEIEDGSENILDEMIHGEQMSLLRRELAFIRSDYRNIVVAYYIDNKSTHDIASSLSISVNAVQQCLHRARKNLKEGIYMAREFGKLSYNPENILFINNGILGSDGEPWNFLRRSLCKNIMLAAYRNPATAEELAIEVGVALPYTEEELCGLVDAELMKKNGNKYETNFFIVSAQAQEKIFAHLCGIAPELTKAVIDVLEYEVSWKNKNCPQWHEGYQPYEDMKWALLMKQSDVVYFDTLNSFNAGCEIHPKANVGKWGHTIRPNNGEWDILGMETYNGDRYPFVGLHGCVSSPEEKDMPEIGFQQFVFNFHDIDSKPHPTLPYSYGQALVAIANGKSDTVNGMVLDRLEEYGYIKKSETGYKPAFLVMFKDKGKIMSAEAEEKLKVLRRKAADIAMRHYLFCREQICIEIPDFLKNDKYQIEHACANIFTLRGAVLEEALRQGYIAYNQDDDVSMLGTFMII